MIRRGLQILVAASCAFACSAPASKPEGVKNPPDAGSGPCTTDPRVDAYAPNMSKPGESGVLTFEIVKSEPAPPMQGNNTFTVKITDQAGTAIAADVRVDLTMADRNQPTTVDPVVTFDAMTGIYTIAPLSMHLPGVWKVAFDAMMDSDAGVTADLVTFYFCIES